MKALIVDDERLARAELRRLLRKHPEITVAGEAVDADDALARIAELEPEILFLDIQMPGRDVFEMLEQVERMPMVVFTTAYDEYALRAFDVSAIDYLLKPIDAGRLAATVARLLERAHSAAPPHRAGLPGGGQIFVKDGERCWFVKLEDVVLLESEGNYTRLSFGTHRPCVLRSLNYLEGRLDPARFFRANRRQIINLGCIESVAPSLAGGLTVRLAGGHVAEMSRRQAQKFRELMQL